MESYIKNELLNRTFESLGIGFKMYIHIPIFNMAYPSDWSKLGNNQSWNEIASIVLESIPGQIKPYPFKGRIDESSHSS